MRVVIDETKFDERQYAFAEYLAQIIKRNIEQNRVHEDKVYALTAELTFQICSIMDGAEYIEKDGVVVFPHLAFRETEDSDRVITVEGGGWMHEYVHGFVDSIFDSEEDEAEEEKRRSPIAPDDKPKVYTPYEAKISFESGINLLCFFIITFNESQVIEALIYSIDEIVDPEREDAVDMSSTVAIKDICRAFQKTTSLDIIDNVTKKTYMSEKGDFSGFSIESLAKHILQCAEKIERG